MEFSRLEIWSRQPLPSPWDLPNPGIKPRSPELQADSLPAEPPGKAIKNQLEKKKHKLIKPTVRYHFTLTTMAMINIDENTCWWGGGGPGTFTLNGWERNAATLQVSWQFLKWVNTDLLHDPAIPLLGIHPRRNENTCQHKDFYTNVHCSIIHSSQKGEIIQITINWSMNKQNVI